MINIQLIDDNECFKLNIVRYLNLADHSRITKADKELAIKLDFKDKISSKNLSHWQNQSKTFMSISLFGYESKENIQPIYQKNVVKKNVLIYY